MGDKSHLKPPNNEHLTGINEHSEIRREIVFSHENEDEVPGAVPAGIGHLLISMRQLVMHSGTRNPKTRWVNPTF